MLHSLPPLPPPPSIAILIRTECQVRSNTPSGESRKKKTVDLLLSRDKPTLQFIKSDNCLGSRVQTEDRDSVYFPFGVVNKESLEDLSKFLGATFTNHNKIVGPHLPSQNLEHA